MRIAAGTEIERVAWEGALEPLGETYRAALSARVTLGEPVWWSAAEALKSQTGKEWAPPAGGRVYTLVQLTCSLHEPTAARTRYRRATLAATLSPQYGSGRVFGSKIAPGGISKTFLSQSSRIPVRDTTALPGSKSITRW